MRAFDRKRGVYVAIKIIKARKAFFEQAATEIRILKHIQRHDPEGKYHIGTNGCRGKGCILTALTDIMCV